MSTTSEDAVQIRDAMLRCYEDLFAFVATPTFRQVHAELYSLPPNERPKYVLTVLMNPDALRERGVVPPTGVLIQRSAFGDRRPTLFCVKKYLPKELQLYWQNVNITFDNPVDDELVPRDQRAWRKPLPAGAQATLIAHNMTAEDVGVT